MSLSENIKKYRLAKGFTQEQLASVLGLSAQAISKWETTETYPDGALLVPLANALGVSLDVLFDHRSGSLKDTAEEIRQFLSSVPIENGFSAVWDLCWQIEKEMFRQGYPLDIPYDPEELKRISESSYILNNYGFTHVSNGRAPFFMAVPACDSALSEVFGDGEEMRKIFAALSSPETMRVVLFLHRYPDNYAFEKNALEELCGVENESLDRVIGDLITLRLVYSFEVEIDEQTTRLYCTRPSHLLMALFLITHEMNYRGGYCLQACNRDKPFLM